MHLERTQEICRGFPLGIQYRNDQHEDVRKLPKVGKKAICKAGGNSAQTLMGLGTVPVSISQFGKKPPNSGESTPKDVASAVENNQLYAEHCYGPPKKITQNIRSKRDKGMKAVH